MREYSARTLTQPMAIETANATKMQHKAQQVPSWLKAIRALECEPPKPVTLARLGSFDWPPRSYEKFSNC